HNEVLFAVDNRSQQILFSKQGITYRFDKRYKNPNRRKGDPTKPKYLIETETIHMFWENASPDVALIAEDEAMDNNIYAMLNEDRSACYALEHVKGFKKLIYKELYPGIDVEYEFHPV